MNPDDLYLWDPAVGAPCQPLDFGLCATIGRTTIRGSSKRLTAAMMVERDIGKCTAELVTVQRTAYIVETVATATIIVEATTLRTADLSTIGSYHNAPAAPWTLGKTRPS